jgi:hypothetical protein
MVDVRMGAPELSAFAYDAGPDAAWPSSGRSPPARQ